MAKRKSTKGQTTIYKTKDRVPHCQSNRKFIETDVKLIPLTHIYITLSWLGRSNSIRNDLVI